ncbi:MAG TPA: AsmA-like C-terminal domain-containing protein [Geminicoccus sp.]|uniref:YhdP family protein n=1 Tax=Geminicoccus sp. TaxID=2024832 RepID=UPI002E372B03|nr:AsmA-like C-terminal domain-containing protein [Geminicoccus sp.]HEX2525877.1 AsmA-like C-terminal domain-containing protein [Geminicoccus sp.]
MSLALSRRKPSGRTWGLLQAAGAALAVVVVLVAALVIGLFILLQQGPISLQPLVPWLKAPLEERVGRPVDVERLELARAIGEDGGFVLTAGPISVGGDAPARAERLVLQVTLPFELRAAKLEVVDADARTLLAAWPEALASEARTQVGAIVRSGTIERGTLDYRFNEVGPDDINLDIQSRNPTIQLPNGLPSVTGETAHVVLNQGVLHVTAPKVTGAGLTAQSVDVTIDHILDDVPSRLLLKSQISGPAGGMYQLFSDPPLALVPRDLVEVRSLRGVVSGFLTLGLPLVDNIPAEAVEIRANGRYRNLSGRLHVPMPIDLTQGAGTFSVRDGAIEMNGRAHLFGTPIHVAMTDRWRGTGQPRRIELRGPVDQALITHFGFDLPEAIKGRAQTVAVLTAGEPPVWHARVDADLLDLSIEEEISGLYKPEGVPGQITIESRVAGHDDWSVERFDLETGEQRVAGHLRPEGGKISLRLDQLLTPRMDLVGDLLLGPEAAVGGSIAAKRIQMPPDEETSDDPPADEARPAPPTRLDLEIYIDELQTRGDPIRGVKGHVQRGGHGFSDVFLDFDLGGPGKFVLAPEQNAHRLDLMAPDAGRLLQALGAGDALVGGQLKVEAAVTHQIPKVIANGRIDLARTQVRMSGNELTPFRKIVIPFAIDGPVITIEQARMTGSVLGLRLSGTIDRDTRGIAMSGEATPLYPLNRFVGQIPILGRILGGAKGLGAINAELTISGTLDAPDVKLAASSVLLPGSIRDLLRSIEPPRER